MKLAFDKKKLVSTAVIVVTGVVAVSTVVFATRGGGGGGMGGGPGGMGDLGSVEMSESVINVKLETPTIGSLSRETEFIGKIQPAESVSVYPEVSGKVTKVYFEAGETVNKGDLLFEMDDSDAQLSYQMQQASYDQQVISANTTLGSSYESKIISAESQLKSAQQSLTSARQNLNEYNDGSQDRLISAEKEYEKLQTEIAELEDQIDAALEAGESTSDLEKQLASLEVELSVTRAEINELEDDDDATARSYRNAYKTAQANYETAKANYDLVMSASLDDTKASVDAQLKSAALSLEQSASSLDKYRVYAPISGVIETKNVSEYETPSMSTAAYTISNKDTMTVQFNASADAAGALSIGDTVTVTKSGADYTATIVEINTKADESSGLFPIKARLDETSSSLLTGVSVKVSAATQKAENALLIPIDVVYYDDSQPYVFTYSGGQAHRTDIVTGMSNSETVAVESGLTSDSQIITTWHPDLKDGAKVQLAEGQQDPEAGQEAGNPGADVPEGTSAPGAAADDAAPALDADTADQDEASANAVVGEDAQVSGGEALQEGGEQPETDQTPEREG